MKKIIIILSLAVLTLVCGCSKDKSGQEYTFLSKDAPENLTKSDITKVAMLNNFSLKLTSKMSELQANGSFVYSPVSIAYVLGMLAEGADGATREEIVSALGFEDYSQSQMNEFFRNLIVLSSKPSSSCESLEIANIVLTDGTLRVKENYKKMIKQYYDADVREGCLDVGFINSWVSAHTHGLINNFIDNYEIARVSAAIVNSLYFKGMWADGFDISKTAKQNFKSPVSGERLTDFMNKYVSKSTAVHYSEGFDCQWLMCDFGDEENNSGDYSMIFTLPVEGKTPEMVLSSMGLNNWEQQMSSFKSANIDIKLPKFETSTVSGVTDALSALGIRRAFSADADFSAFSDVGLFASMIKHAARLAIDEEGSEAAAATILYMATSPGTEDDKPQYFQFYADRPFIFSIIEKRTGTILFQGIYK